jgi:hypothetical protein
VVVDSNSPHWSEGGYSPRLHGALAHELHRAVSVFVLRCCTTLRDSDVVLSFFVHVYVEPEKHHPRLRSSDQQRLTFDDLAVFCVHGLMKELLFCLPGPLLLLLSPRGHFTFLPVLSQLM